MSDIEGIEYRLSPLIDEWVSFGKFMSTVGAWAMTPGAGPPAVTLSKRVTVHHNDQPSQETERTRTARLLDAVTHSGPGYDTPPTTADAWCAERIGYQVGPVD